MPNRDYVSSVGRKYQSVLLSVIREMLTNKPRIYEHGKDLRDLTSVQVERMAGKIKTQVRITMHFQQLYGVLCPV